MADLTTLIPQNAPQKYSLIWLHGLGSSPDEFEYVFQHFPLVTENFRVILPKAPTCPVTVNGGFPCNSWFDILGLGGEKFNINFEDVKQSSLRIDQLVSEELKIVKDTKNIFIGGFSQGAMMTMHYVLESEQVFGGMIICSGLLFPQTKPKNFKTPILRTHGDMDDIVDFELSEKSLEKVNSKFEDKEYYVMQDQGHTIDGKALVKIEQFISKKIK